MYIVNLTVILTLISHFTNFNKLLTFYEIWQTYSDTNNNKMWKTYSDTNKFNKSYSDSNKLLTFY